jgi:hypothetical protein
LSSYEIRRASGLRDTATDSLFALAELDHSTGNDGEARRFAGEGLALMEAVRKTIPSPELKASFYGRQRKFFDLMVEIEMVPGRKGGVESGFLAADRGLGRAAMDLAVEAHTTGPSSEEALRRRAGIQREIDLLAMRLSTTAANQMERLRRRVETLVSEDERIGATIDEAASRTTGRPLESVAELQKQLPRDAALLEFHLAEPASVMWLVERDGIQVFPLPGRKEIEDSCATVVRLFPEILERRRSPLLERKFELAEQLLSAKLLGGLRNHPLPPRLIVIPDGALSRVPFAALEMADGRLGLRHELIQAPSAAFLVAGRKPRSVVDFPRSILAIADPVYSVRDPRAALLHPASSADRDSPVDLARLPFTDELNTIETMVRPSRRRVLRGFNASTANLRAELLEDYAYLHLSAHALIDDQLPELSRIALSMISATGNPVDGFLRSSHLSGFRLNGSTVVLSACETALGKQLMGEGLMGLTTSLFAAGAAQMILTVSSVDAESSSEFFSQLYRQIFSGTPISTERAVMLSRRILASSPRWSDPYYWASYTVYGRPRETP